MEPKKKAKAYEWRKTDVKRCPKCEQVKGHGEFYRCAKYGLSGWCVTCQAEKARKRRTTKARFNGPVSKECRKCDGIFPHECFPRNRAMADGLGQYCKPCQRKAGAAVYLKNGKAHRAARAKVIAADPSLLMYRRVLQLVRKALERRNLRDKSSSVTGSFWAAVGYTKAELARHIERQFLEGMSWTNPREWHIDHILPVSSFCFASYTDPSFKACWALSNLRPLWAKDNLEKQDKILFLL